MATAMNYPRGLPYTIPQERVRMTCAQGHKWTAVIECEFGSWEYVSGEECPCCQGEPTRQVRWSKGDDDDCD